MAAVSLEEQKLQKGNTREFETGKRRQKQEIYRMYAFFHFFKPSTVSLASLEEKERRRCFYSNACD
jgi:hypothetical protein